MLISRTMNGPPEDPHAEVRRIRALVVSLVRGHPVVLTSTVVLAAGLTAGLLLAFRSSVPSLTPSYIAAVNTARVNWQIAAAPTSANARIDLAAAESAAQEGPFGPQASIVRAGLVILKDKLTPKGTLAWAVFLDPPGSHVVVQGGAGPKNGPVPPDLKLTSAAMNYYVEVISAKTAALLEAGEGASPRLPPLPTG